MPTIGFGYSGTTGSTVIGSGSQGNPGQGSGRVRRQASIGAALTSAAGTPAGGTVDVGGAFAQATLNNNFATLVTRINAIQTALQSAGVTL